MSLPNSGTVSYNGIAFTSLYKSKVEVKPRRDSAGRALTVREYSLDIDGRVTAPVGFTTDATLGQMRIALEKPAGALIYSQKGFNPLEVNVAGGDVWDAAYGPWPEVLSWEPIGNDQSCNVRWRCTTLVPCEEYPKKKGILEYCWSESWDIDEDGYTTRTIDGHLTIVATRTSVNSRGVSDNADDYLEDVLPDLPVGFRRKPQKRKLSEDRRTLEFSFVDEEMAAPLPPGISTADVHHRVTFRSPLSAGKPGAAAIASYSISGTITLPARTPKSFAFEKILLILRSRWGDMGAGLAAKRNGLTYFLDTLEIDDEMFGRSTGFSASVKVLGSPFSSIILQNSGLWTAIPGTSFVAWKQSIFGKTGRAMGPRGVAAMKFQNQDDAIVDLCDSGELLTANPNNPGRSLATRSNLPRQLNGVALNPLTTWLNYRLRLRLLESDRIARHMLIGSSIKNIEQEDGTEGLLQTQLPNSGNLVPPNSPTGTGQLIQETAALAAVGTVDAGYVSPPVGELHQQVSAPKYTLRLEGGAIRIGYPIPVPRLQTVGGQEVTQLRQNTPQEQISSIAGVPVYAAQWAIDYSLPGWVDSESLGMPVNPANPAM